VEAAAGLEVTTIEGLAKGGNLHPVQEAFIEHTAFQCAFCTPGFIMSAVALLSRNPQPDDRQIRAALTGNICRCGTYVRILQAAKAAAERMGQEGGK
jgi:aerobic-type carbon monoxide dehydrogenase small subunit (CoxS/CutS family)